MNKTALSSAIFAALALSAGSATATGFVTLPATGVAVPAYTNPVTGVTTPAGTSAYVTCNTSGDFGSNPNGSTPPTFSPNGGTDNTCAVPNNNPPLSGYNQVASTSRNIVINGRTIGTVSDRVWRSGSSCIYGAKIRLDNVDYDPTLAGTQYYEINDIARAGFRNRAPISAAYNFVTTGPNQSDEVVYRAGLTYTSVVHQPGDSAQPLTSVAPISTNWVDFTTDVNFMDPDGSSVRDSSWAMVKSSCTTAAPASLNGALRLRQKGQEGQPDLEISVPAYVPAGANTTP